MAAHNESEEKTRPITTSAVNALEDLGSTMNDDYPLGRRKAWFTVFGSCLLTFCSVGIPTSFGVFQDFYTRTWLNNCTASQISWIGSMQLFLELCFAPIAGILFDSKRFRATVIIGCVLLTFSFFLVSLSRQHVFYQLFLSQGIGMGLGIGLLYLPAATVVSQHFKARKSFAMGLVSASGPLGGVIYSIMLNNLINGRMGFAWAVRIAAFLTLGCCVIANLVIFEVKREKSQTMRNREKSISIWDTPFILIMLGAFLASLSTYFPIFFIQIFARLHGVDEGLAFYSVSIFNVSCTLGRIVPNFLADRFGPMNVYMYCAFFFNWISGASLTEVIESHSFGFFVGGLLSVYLPMIATLRTNSVNIGKRMGVSLVPVGVAYLIGSPIMSAALGSDFTWWKGITFGTTTILGAFLIMVIVKLLIRRAEQVD
ncbi:MFS general substrate transporter [Sanghuangporus baumii]|uniref:MFS general substrate transporter n=1 Tax=Sanghuangporus baumii TaxID=108892 RepID=A0A9Q5I6N1_SANBA|nr:MFS general substrate transporter [Sanghuangporus baumii]